MLAFDFKQHIDPIMLEKFSERGRRRIFKTTLTEAMRYWHIHILPKHFSLSGQAMYGSDFKKKKNGKPSLVESGVFRDRVLKDPVIASTYKGARIKYQFGRPEQSNKRGNLENYRNEYLKDYMKLNPRDMERKTRNHIFHFMKGKSIKFEDARKQLLQLKQKDVFKVTSYNAKTKVQMARGVSAFNDRDRSEVREFIARYLVDNMARLGVANVKKGGV